MSPLTRFRDVGLLLTRVLLGVILIAHGWQKLVTNGLEATGTMFAQAGVPLPGVSAGIAGGVELLGGLALLLGALTPLAGLAVTAVLFGAFLFVHAGNGIFVSEGGWELVAALAIGAAQLAFVGPGRFSVDHAILRARRTTPDHDSYDREEAEASAR